MSDTFPPDWVNPVDPQQAICGSWSYWFRRDRVRDIRQPPVSTLMEGYYNLGVNPVKRAVYAAYLHRADHPVCTKGDLISVIEHVLTLEESRIAE